MHNDELEREYAAWFKERFRHLKAAQRRSARAWVVARVGLFLTLLAVPWSTGDGQVWLAPFFIPPSHWQTIAGAFIGTPLELPERPLVGLLLGEWVGCFVLALVLGWRPADQARGFIRTAQQFFNTSARPRQPVAPQGSSAP